MNEAAEKNETRLVAIDCTCGEVLGDYHATIDRGVARDWLREHWPHQRAAGIGFQETHVDALDKPVYAIFPVTTDEPPPPAAAGETIPQKVSALEGRGVVGTLGLDLDHIFRYHAPTPEQQRRYEAIRASAKDFARVVLHATSAGADQSAAIRKIREAVMTANASIALEPPATSPKPQK